MVYFELAAAKVLTSCDDFDACGEPTRGNADGADYVVRVGASPLAPTKLTFFPDLEHGRQGGAESHQRTISAAPTTPTCFLGPACSWIGPGHSMAFAQDHIAAAEPEGWHDSIVEEVTPGGWIRLSAVHGAASILVWNHSDLSGVLSPGDPVAINPKHHVLAAGDYRFNVLSV